MKVLVTGSSGFIGSHLCRGLEREGHAIVKLDKEHGGVLSQAIVEHYCIGVDHVFHLAAISSVEECENHRLHAKRVNVDGTWNVLSTAAKCGVKKAIFISSAAVYEPHNVYAWTKVVGESYCGLSKELFRTPYVVLRLFNVYGPSQKNGVIPNLITKLRAGEQPVIEGNGEQKRDFVHIDDVVDAMIESLNYEGVHDIGTGWATSINELEAELSEIICGKRVQPTYIKGRENDMAYSQARLSWFTPKYTLMEGLDRMLRHENTSS